MASESVNQLNLASVIHPDTDKYVSLYNITYNGKNVIQDYDYDYKIYVTQGDLLLLGFHTLICMFDIFATNNHYL